MHGTRCLLARCIGCSGRGRKAWRDLLLARRMRRSMHAGRRSGGTCPQSFLRILPAARYSYLCSSSCLHQPVLTAVSWGAVGAGGVMCVCASLPSPAVRGLCACIFAHFFRMHAFAHFFAHFACMHFACMHCACMHFACMHFLHACIFFACIACVSRVRVLSFFLHARQCLLCSVCTVSYVYVQAKGYTHGPERGRE
jgi:hypothetical protein